ncbi:hypothetical protein BGCPKDLD_1847 [Methylorubrum suomiense]|uniref:Uncharacterized protein n=1 Tax=Methylorubrum suomiense TaxID=144191 RepID=A0ABQ4UV31_9HYPH|nr:hypothetical protein BGCPKDLD_1847 [Methylorubrum suomiense]
MNPVRLSLRRLAVAILLTGAATVTSTPPVRAQAVQAQDAVFPPSSRFGFSAPAGMTASKRFTGFERRGGGAVVSVVELPGPAYEEMKQSFTDETLKTQGLVVRSREPVTLADGLEGVLFTGEATAAEGIPAVNKWLLIVGGGDVTGLIIAQVAVGTESDENIRAMLTSVKLRPALSLDEQVAALPFRIGDPAGFRPVRALAGNSVLMTLGPRDQISAIEQPILVIAQATQAPTPQEQRDGLARQALFANQTMKDFQIERSQSYRQNGVDWHEIVARAVDVPTSTPVVVAQTIRFNPDGYIRAVGVTRAEQRSDVLPLFRQVVDSLQMK